MWFVQLVIKVLRELYFDRKEESDIRSKHFKPKRFVAFTFGVVTALGLLFVTGRLLFISVEFHKVQKQLEICLNFKAAKEPAR